MSKGQRKGLWGIYHTDREYAREIGDPLRAVVEAPTKIAAEAQAVRLGFDDPWPFDRCSARCSGPTLSKNPAESGFASNRVGHIR